MLAHFRSHSLRSTRPHLLCRPAPSCRQLSFTSVRFAEKGTDEAGENGVESADADVEDVKAGDAYETWLKKTGISFRDHDRPRNWLGGIELSLLITSAPFPLNPSFTPPTPVSDQLRNKIYQQFMSDPTVNDVRALSERYGLSLKRVDAILRLKGLEASMKQGKSLQSGFQKGMEKILGVPTEQSISLLSPGMDELGDNATQADYQDEIEGNNEARYRYQRMFWEPVEEGQEPMVTARLQTARSHARKFAQAAEDAKSDPKLLGRRSKPSGDNVHVVERPGRTTLKFVDIGGKFLDVNDRVRRMKEGERRVKLKGKRRAKTSVWANPSDDSQSSSSPSL
ncbi:eukaryotic mitochondrial regulator protein-domain-containing protein [Cristinia sonorae]|uniref:Eukaryotic mitochondrial regulator protein-domain-containing protein n=1 Tax=Cristinia sonorae TaxID=1940300 RepID=A0A8K0XRF5_9AGAR|nr:eukaryotic mitochondrial regulator protein-domain-containing protein [Cristinia sonorae]